MSIKRKGFKMKYYKVIGVNKHNGNKGTWTIKLEENEKLEDNYIFQSIVVDSIEDLGNIKEMTYFVSGYQASLNKNDDGGYCEYTIVLKDGDILEDDYRYKSFDKIYSCTLLNDDRDCKDIYVVVTPSVKNAVTVVKASSIIEAYAKGRNGGIIEYIEKITDKVFHDEKIEEKIKNGFRNIAHFEELHYRMKRSCRIFGTYRMPLTCAFIQEIESREKKGNAVDKVKNILLDLHTPLCDLSLDERRIFDIKLFRSLED